MVSLVSRRSLGIFLGIVVAIVAVLFARSRLFAPQTFTVKKLAESDIAARLNGRRALIVGGTKGIGLGFARALAKRGANVSIAGRSDGQGVINELKELSKEHQSEHEFLKADVSLAKSSASFAKDFSARHPKLDFLIVTVGSIPDGIRTETSEGVQTDFALNFFASRFVLLHEMLELLTTSHTRVILLGTFDFNMEVDLSDIQSKKDFGFLKALGVTHVANAMLVNELSKREKAFEIFGFTPGIVNSAVYRAWTGDTWKGWLLDKVVSLVGSSIDSYAEAMIHTVVSDELRGRSGLFFHNKGNSHEANKWLYNDENSAKFYEECLKLMASVLTKEE